MKSGRFILTVVLLVGFLGLGAGTARGQCGYEFLGWWGLDDMGGTGWHEPGSGLVGVLGDGPGQFNRPTGICSDSEGNIYVVDALNYRVQVFMKDGTIRILGKGIRGSGNDEFDFPGGVVVDDEGYVYVADTYNHRILKFLYDETMQKYEYEREWGLNSSPVVDFNMPMDIEINSEGHIFVVDYGNHRIQKYDGNSWSIFYPKNSENQLNGPEGMAIDIMQNDTVYVANTGNNRIQIINSNGDLINSWEVFGPENEQFDYPTNPLVDRQGLVYIADSHNDRIIVFDRNGNFLNELGGPGTNDAQFNRIPDLCSDTFGYIYVTDLYNHRVQKFGLVGNDFDWSTYFGGGAVDYGFDAVTDEAGNIYITGRTNSAGIELARNSYLGGSYDGYVAKINPCGNLMWMSYIGGSGEDQSTRITLDDEGNIFMTGHTSSTDLPNAINSYHGALYDAFVIKLDPEGVVLWSTYLGGNTGSPNSGDYGAGIAINNTGEIMVAGYTYSVNFEGANNNHHGNRDGFVAKLDAEGTLLWATLMGSGGGDYIFEMKLDESGNAYVVGGSESSGFDGALNSYHGGFSDAFISQVNPDGDMNWAMYLGGPDEDIGAGLDLDKYGHLYVTGYTTSITFDEVINSSHGSREAFLTKLVLDGSPQVIWSEFLGGSNQDWGGKVVVDGIGDIFITGPTESTNFTGLSNSYFGGVLDAYIIKVNYEGTILWGNYIGGNGYEEGLDIALDKFGNVLVTGVTWSTDFVNANNTYKGGAYDGYVAKASIPLNHAPIVDAGDDVEISAGEQAETTLYGTALDADGDDLEYRWYIEGHSPWAATYGGSNYDEGYNVTETADGGYALVGYSNSSGAGSYDVYLVKTNIDGVEEWSATYGGSGDDRGLSVQQTVDGGYIIGGWTTSFGAGSRDHYLHKTDACGVLEWSNTFGGSNSDTALSAIATDDGGYMIVGETYSFITQGGASVYVVKTDGNGDEEWHGTYPMGSNTFSQANSVQQTTDGGYILAGHTGSGYADAFLIRIDSVGTSLWEKTYSSNYRDTFYSVQIADDGGYFLVGDSGATFVRDMWAVKTDMDGNVEWERFYNKGNDDRGQSGAVTADGGFIASGWTDNNGSGLYDVYVVKMDVNGDMERDYIIGGSGEERGRCVIESAPGVYVIGGFTTSYGLGSADYYLIKLGSTVGQVLLDWTAVGAGGEAYLDLGSLPSFGSGQYELTLEAREAGVGGLTASDDMVLTITNTAPLAFDDEYGIDEDLLLDVDGDMLTAVKVSDPLHGALLEFNEDGSFIYQPDENFNGTDSFEYYAFDGTAPSENATVTIGINPINDPPTADDQAVPAFDEDTSEDIELSGSDVETAAVNLVYTIVDLPLHGSLTPLGGQNYRYEPTENYNGADSFTFRVSDDGDPAGSHANPGDLTSEPATVTLTVTAVNDAPEVDAGEDVVISRAEQLSTVLLGMGTDVDGDGLGYRWMEGTTVLLDWTAVGAGGEAYLDLSLSPYFAFGDHTLTLEVNDGEFTVSDDMVLTIDGYYGVGSFVALGKEGVWLKQGASVVHGNVGASYAAVDDYLRDGVEVSVGPGVEILDSGTRVLGNSVKVNQGGQVYDVYYNLITGLGDVLGVHYTPVELPLASAFPEVPEFLPGTVDIELAKNDAVVLDAGQYGLLKVRLGSTVTFTGGVYHFDEWDVRDNVNLYFAEPTEIRVAGKLATGNGTYSGPAPGAVDLDARDIVIYVNGINGSNGGVHALVKAAKFGLNNTLITNVYVPNGTCLIREGSAATGAFLGRWVIIGYHVTVDYMSVWSK